MIRALTPGGRVSAMNRDVTVLQDGAVEKLSSPTAPSCARCSAGHFGFDLPEVERLRVPSVPEWD